MAQGRGQTGGLGDPAERNDPGSVRIGSLGGVDVMVRSSWLLVAALIAYLAAPQIEQVAPELGNLKYVAGVAFAILLTLSLLLHELSHALMAKHFGIGVRSITLHFIGGVTSIDGEPANAKQELAISAVGPITSLAIGGAAFGLWQVTPEGLLSWVVGGLAGTNLFVGALNLVPGLPLDGGRVLRAAVWKVTGNPNRATLISGWAGRVVALLVLVSPALFASAGVAVDLFDYVIALIFGWFLWTAATNSIMTAKIRSRLPALQARTLARRTLSLSHDLPVIEAMRQATEAQAGAIVTLDSAGQVRGVVNEAAAVAIPAERRPWVTLDAVTRGLDPGLTLSADLEGEALLTAMQQRPATEYLLVEEGGEIYGVLSTADVDAAFGAAR